MKRTLFIMSLLMAFITNAQDISGTYYVGEPNYDANLEHPWKRGFTEVSINYDAQKTSIELTYNKDEKAMVGTPHALAQTAAKSGTLYSFTMSNIGPNCLINADLLQIEPGIFVVQPATTVDNSCVEVKRATKSNAPAKGGKVYPVESLVREFILGKNKSRVDALCANPSEFQQLVEAAVIAKCKLLNDSKAEAYPLPKEGMTEQALKSEVHEAINAWAKTRNWSQTVERSFIKSTEWETLRQGTKTIGRQARAIVIYSKNGTCEWKEFAIQQDYNGSSYGKTYVTGEMPGGFAVKCN